MLSVNLILYSKFYESGVGSVNFVYKGKKHYNFFESAVGSAVI